MRGLARPEGILANNVYRICLIKTKLEYHCLQCTVEKVKTKKVVPDITCKKRPKKICAKNNCKFVPGAKVFAIILLAFPFSWFSDVDC